MTKIVLPPLPDDLDPDEICAEFARARDLEVARVVLEAAGEALQDARVQLKHAKHAAAFDAATIIVRTLEVAHHE